MTRITELLSKAFEELTNEELVELKTLLAENDIDVDVIDAETLETIKNIFKEEDTMTNATLFQIKRDGNFEANFSKNMTASIRGVGFVQVSEMEAVHTYAFDEVIHEKILERVFCEAQDGGAFNYSMSVGDVVNIGDDWYRCTSDGWDNINDEVSITEAFYYTLNNKEEEEMNTAGAVREEVEVTMGDKAKEFAEARKEDLEKLSGFVIENVPVVKAEVEKMLQMPSDKLGDYIVANGSKVIGNIIKGVKDFASSKKKEAKDFPFFADAVTESAEKAEAFVKTVEEITDEEGKKGWGKIKKIVKALIGWILKIVIKIGAVIFKVALTIAVGIIAIGSAAVLTAGSVAGIAYKEVAKPVFNGGKKVVTKVKDKIVDIKDSFTDDFDELFEEESDEPSEEESDDFEGDEE